MLDDDFVIPESPWVEGIGTQAVIVDEDKVALRVNPDLMKSSREYHAPLVAFQSFLLAPKLRGFPEKSLLVGQLRQAIDSRNATEYSTIVIVSADQLVDKAEFLFWGGLRELMTCLTPQEMTIASRAVQLCRWRREHRYCGVCGSETCHANEDRAMVCSACSHRMYARISPCVIGVITRGKQILLARGRRHSAAYSTVAGFIEPGESAEEAFAREVSEEVGIQVKNIRYQMSQPWPFPGQLMLGFTADYDGGDIVIETKEIEDAQWFDVDRLPTISPAYTISGRLINMAVRDVNMRIDAKKENLHDG